MSSQITNKNHQIYNLNSYVDEKAKRAFLPKLTQNLHLAALILKFVKTAVPFSTNNNLRGKSLTDHLSEVAFIAIRKSWDEDVNKLRGRTLHLDTEKNWGELARAIKGVGIANCHGLSIVGCAYAMETLHLKEVEIFEISDEDHCFIVIGRNLVSNQRDYTTWGDTCVVCDIWAESYYPSNQIIPKLHNYKDIHISNGRVIPILDPFDLRYYELSRLAVIKNQENLPPSSQSVI